VIEGVEAVVFDFDGLVLETEMPVFSAWCAAFESYGCAPPTLEEWSTTVGTKSSDADLIDAIRSGAQRPFVEELMHEERRAFRDAMLAAEVVRPGVVEWIHEAEQAGIGVAIASSSPDDWVLGHLDRLGLRERFAHVVCAGGSLPGKPAPDVYLTACAALGVHSGLALAIEDSPNGIAAAKAAGMRCITVPNPVTESLDLSAADLRLGSLADCTLGEAITRLRSIDAIG
jgi:HAD superfamily hydrolase (TIGR01509 family)